MHPKISDPISAILAIKSNLQRRSIQTIGPLPMAQVKRKRFQTDFFLGGLVKAARFVCFVPWLSARPTPKESENPTPTVVKLILENPVEWITG